MIAVNSPAGDVEADAVEGADLGLALAVDLGQLDDAGERPRVRSWTARGASAVHEGVAVIRAPWLWWIPFSAQR